MLFVTASLGLYLWFAYARIYNIIGDANLTSPYIESRIVLQNATGAGKVKYVVVGDSLGAGVGAGTVEETYPYVYAKKLLKNHQEVNVVNLARPGDTTNDVIKNQLGEAVAEAPDYVTVLIGINDIHNHVSADQFEKNYHHILTTLLSDTRAAILVINLPYMASEKLVYPPYTLLLDLRTREFNVIIKALVVASGERVKYVDLYSGVKDVSKTDSAYYSSDYFHPSGKGYGYWSQIINATK